MIEFRVQINYNVLVSFCRVAIRHFSDRISYGSVGKFYRDFKRKLKADRVVFLLTAEAVQRLN
jgi:hypothetical protein